MANACKEGPRDLGVCCTVGGVQRFPSGEQVLDSRSTMSISQARGLGLRRVTNRTGPGPPTPTDRRIFVPLRLRSDRAMRTQIVRFGTVLATSGSRTSREAEPIRPAPDPTSAGFADHGGHELGLVRVLPDRHRQGSSGSPARGVIARAAPFTGRAKVSVLAITSIPSGLPAAHPAAPRPGRGVRELPGPHTSRRVIMTAAAVRAAAGQAMRTSIERPGESRPACGCRVTA